MRTVFALILALSAGCGKPAPTTPITIDGSSMVYPLTQEAAELYEKSGDGRVSLAYSGTVTGFGKFCRGQLDIVNASRPKSLPNVMIPRSPSCSRPLICERISSPPILQL